MIKNKHFSSTAKTWQAIVNNDTKQGLEEDLMSTRPSLCECSTDPEDANDTKFLAEFVKPLKFQTNVVPKVEVKVIEDLPYITEDMVTGFRGA